MATQTFTKSGNKATVPVKLDKNVFGLTVENHDLLKQAYVAYLANGRLSSATTKTRGEVSGGGKKPWKQKGTGRARFGSSRVPIWRGGGITFGPSGNENYSHKLPLKAKRQAIRQALSVANASDKVAVIEGLSFKKTTEAATLLTKIGAERNVLLVVEAKTPEITQATTNLSKVKVVQATYVNVFDVLNADKIVFTSTALNETTKWLAAVKEGSK